jgi:hypothetical protein
MAFVNPNADPTITLPKKWQSDWQMGKYQKSRGKTYGVLSPGYMETSSYRGIGSTEPGMGGGLSMINPTHAGGNWQDWQGGTSMRRRGFNTGIHGLKAAISPHKDARKFILDMHQGSTHGMDMAQLQEAGVVGGTGVSGETFGNVGDAEERQKAFIKRQTQLVLDTSQHTGASAAHKAYLAQHLADQRKSKGK